MALGHRHIALQQQRLAVCRPVDRADRAFAFQRHAAARGVCRVGDQDVVVGIARRSAGPGDDAAIIGPQRAAIARSGFGVLRDLAAAEIEPVGLVILVTAAVLGEQEGAAFRADVCRADGFGIEGQLPARAAGEAHFMDLADIGKPGGDQDAAFAGPVLEAVPAHVLVARQAFLEFG